MCVCACVRVRFRRAQAVSQHNFTARKREFLFTVHCATRSQSVNVSRPSGSPAPDSCLASSRPEIVESTMSQKKETQAMKGILPSATEGGDATEGGARGAQGGREDGGDELVRGVWRPCALLTATAVALPRT